MKFLVLMAAVAIGLAIYFLKTSNPLEVTSTKNPTIVSPNGIPQVSVIAQNLDTPWAIAFLPQGDMLVTQRPGRVSHIDQNGVLDPNPINIDNVVEMGEGGLLGIALHPNFSQNHYIYLYYTYYGSGDNTRNRVVRMTYENNTLGNQEIIVDNIPGASNHNGGRIKFGPDNFLYITTGDAQDPSLAQNTNTFAGKILRVTDEGEAAAGNPFNNLVFSYGHRNPQGLAWDTEGNLWSTEHGRSGIQSGLDEINLINAGNNYGWPDIEGDKTAPQMITPVRNSGNTTWAPAGAAFIDNSLFFAGLRGSTLYEAIIENGQVKEIKEHFNGQFGRLREVIVGPDKMLYITTSNKDGRGIPQTGDDKVIRMRYN